jgi:hypothetical protein
MGKYNIGANRRGERPRKILAISDLYAALRGATKRGFHEVPQCPFLQRQSHGEGEQPPILSPAIAKVR